MDGAWVMCGKDAAMLVTDSVVFAVRAGLKVFGVARQAYIDGTVGAVLTLPLPASGGVDYPAARAYFRSLKGDERSRFPEVNEVLAIEFPTPEEKLQLVEIYEELVAFDLAKHRNLSLDEFQGVLLVRQYAKGKYGDKPTALQRIAGTLVNIAVDYFVERPGELGADRPLGRALRAFVATLDQKDFSTIPLEDVAPGLLLSVLGAVEKTPELIFGGEREQALVGGVVSSLARSVERFLQDVPSTERRDAGVWLEMLGHALIKGGAETVLRNPQKFLKSEGAPAALLEDVGDLLADLIIGEDRITFRTLFSTEGLTRFAGGVLQSVADNPDLLKIKNEGLKKIIVQVAGDLAKLGDRLASDLFPELMRLILEKSANNLDLIWPRNVSRPERNLLFAAARTLLSELSRPAAAGSTWRPVFTRDQVLRTADAVLDEILDNPQWLLENLGDEGDPLFVAVRAIFDSLREVDGTRVSAEAGIAAFQAAFRAVSLNLSFLDQLPGDAAEPARFTITVVLDTVFDVVFDSNFDPAVRWKVARNSALTTIVEVTLDLLARRNLAAADITSLREALSHVLRIPGPLERGSFSEALSTRLNQKGDS